MRITISVIKADIGSVGGHVCPSRRLLDSVRAHVQEHGEGLLIDSYVSYTGDDIAILMAHTRGTGAADIHRLAWDAFMAGTEVARGQGLYGAGQDLLREAFSGNVRGMGPAVAELEFEERPGEPVLFFAADKTDPGCYNYFDGPPVVSCAAFSVHDGVLSEAVDVFAHPFWDTVRANASAKALEMRRQGFFGAAMLPMDELEYTGIVERLAALDARFLIRGRAGGAGDSGA